MLSKMEGEGADYGDVLKEAQDLGYAEGKSFRLTFFHSIFFLRPSLFSLPLSRTADLGSHGRLFSLLLTAVRALRFFGEKNSACSSLVD